VVIRNSAKAIIIVDNKLLVTKMNDGEIFYLLPGGGQNPGEILTDTLKRECKEELGYYVQVNELIFVREGFDNAETHRVEFMFHCTIIGEVENHIPMFDTIQCGLEWIDINVLSSLPLYPEELRYKIKQFYQKENTQIYVGEIK
jgi:8-oxo-dGTP pyrophosphatase MutT (NUDIX family)